jgi:hypothetical protein
LGAALQADGEYEVRAYGPKHQKEKRSMDHFAGLDVSVKETSVCIVDDTGKIVREVKVASEPAAVLVVLKNPAYLFKRIGLEAGPLSQWLYSGLGVTVKDIFWTQGRYDIVIVIEAPDELSATALNLSLSALGNIRTESLRAFSSTDMLKIVAKML